MKLKHKLIPSVSIAVVASAAIPFALFSCGKSDGYVNLLNRYVPTIEQHEQGIFTIDQIYNDYINVVKENPEVFKQDFYWFASNQIIQLGKENAKFHILKISNIKCEAFDVEGKEYSKIPLMSYTLEYQMDYTFQEDNTTKRHLVYNGVSKYQKIPFQLAYDDSDGLWYWQWSVEYLPTVEFARKVNWAANIQYDQTETYTISESPFGPYSYEDATSGEYELNADGLITDVWDEYDAARMLAALNEDAIFTSYYLYDVAKVVQ